jgi:nitrate/TMAO reductase-like tetraheme cytochrome c subunit
LTELGTIRQAPFALGVLALSTHQAMEAGVTGKTCIACHMNIVPELPKDDKDPHQ